MVILKDRGVLVVCTRVCVRLVTVKERKFIENHSTPENICCVAISLPHSVEDSYLWRGFHSLHGLPQCKIYCRLDWVFFIGAFTRHLKRCQECYFLNAFELATAKLRFLVLERYILNGMRAFVRPGSSH